MHVLANPHCSGNVAGCKKERKEEEEEKEKGLTRGQCCSDKGPLTLSLPETCKHGRQDRNRTWNRLGPIPIRIGQFGRSGLADSGRIGWNRAKSTPIGRSCIPCLQIVESKDKKDLQLFTLPKWSRRWTYKDSQKVLRKTKIHC